MGHVGEMAVSENASFFGGGEVGSRRRWAHF
jgi:hypothetical protein